MNSFLLIAPICFLLLLPTAQVQTPAPSRVPLVTDRPDFTESSETVPKGLRQLELGATFGHGSGAQDWSLGELLLRLSTGHRTEMRIGLPGYAALRGAGGRASGFQDLSLGFKVKLRDAMRGDRLFDPNVALIATVTFPSGARAFREEQLQPEIKLCLGWDVNDRLAVSSNLNAAIPSEERASFGQASASVSAGYSITDRAGCYVEWFGIFPPSRGGGPANTLSGGLTYLANPNLQFDIRAGFGLSRSAQKRFAGLGASFRW